MDAYVAEMTRRVAEKRIGAKKALLHEVLKEVRARGSNVTRTYKLPLRASEGKFFTVFGMVEAASQCKEPLCTLSFRLPEPVPVRRPTA
jgi:hypothetical protein